MMTAVSNTVRQIKRDFEDFSEYKNELALPELNGLEWMKYLFKDCDNSMERDR